MGPTTGNVPLSDKTSMVLYDNAFSIPTIGKTRKKPTPGENIHPEPNNKSEYKKNKKSNRAQSLNNNKLKGNQTRVTPCQKNSRKNLLTRNIVQINL